MTRGRKIFAWTVGILLLLLAVLIIIIATFDWNRLKPTINEKVSAELHRPFAINGNLAVLWRREPDEGVGVPGCRGRTCRRRTSHWATPNGRKTLKWSPSNA